MTLFGIEAWRELTYRNNPQLENTTARQGALQHSYKTMSSQMRRILLISRCPFLSR